MCRFNKGDKLKYKSMDFIVEDIKFSYGVQFYGLRGAYTDFYYNMKVYDVDNSSSPISISNDEVKKISEFFKHFKMFILRNKDVVIVSDYMKDIIINKLGITSDKFDEYLSIILDNGIISKISYDAYHVRSDFL